MISKKTYFSKEGSRGGGDECKNDGLGALEFHGAVRERVFSFFWRLGGPLGAAKARVMANDDGYPRLVLMVLLFVSSGLRGVPGGVKKIWFGAKQGPGTPPEKLNSDFGAKTERRASQKRDPGGMRRGAGGIIGGFQFLI